MDSCICNNLLFKKDEQNKFKSKYIVLWNVFNFFSEIKSTSK